MTNIIKIKEASYIPNCVMTYGHFTTIHPGHIRYLKHAKDQGDNLIITLLGDGDNKNNSKFEYTQKERAEALSLLSLASYIILLDYDELSLAIQRVKPKALFLGIEYQESNHAEVSKAILEQRQNGGKVIFHSGEIQYASTELLLGSEKKLSEKRRNQFLSSCKRQNLNRKTLLESIKHWESTNLIVLGDTIVDQYAACEAVGMSAEAPVIVVKELETKNFIGGAAVVASHIRALGAKCQFISVVGDDDVSQIVENTLKERDIERNLIKDRSRPTTFKKRYLVENQKLFRVSRLEEHNVDEEIEDKIIDTLERVSVKADGIVISDFVYGVITDRVLEKVYELAKSLDLFLFGDVQCSSQVGSIARFKNFSLLCPNEREARIALQDKDSGLEKLSTKLMESTRTNRLIMKLGSEGFISYDRKRSKGLPRSQPFPALSVNPVDVAGAGDSLLAVMATGIASKQEVMATSALGCCMASLAVENMGNSPIDKESLINFVKDILD